VSTSGVARRLKLQKVYQVTGDATPMSRGRRILVETCVSTLINAFIPAGIIWLIGLPPPKGLLGPHGMLPAIVAATVLPIFLMTLALTYALRRRLVSTHVLAPKMQLKRQFSRLAMPLLPRAVALTLLGLAVLMPAAVAFLHMEALLPMTRYQFALFNVSYGALIGIAITPLIVLATLAEKP
jgi:hypothetical protein